MKQRHCPRRLNAALLLRLPSPSEAFAFGLPPIQDDRSAHGACSNRKRRKRPVHRRVKLASYIYIYIYMNLSNLSTEYLLYI